jgi:glycosyltransferase involved in cell wall biosynthesis
LEAFVESGLGGEGFELWMTAERQDWPAGYDAMVKLAQQAGVEGQLHLLGRVSPEDMNDLYRSATAFAFVSAGESFGHPMVEALSLGLPILALDTAIAREILGSAADYLPEAVSVAGPIMRDALTRGDDDLRRRSQVSLERAQVACVSWHSWLASLENELEAVASG